MPFTRDVQDFVKSLYLSGQTELAGQQQESGEKDDPAVKTQAVNTFRINVQANAACVDLLVWAIADESGKSCCILRLRCAVAFSGCQVYSKLFYLTRERLELGCTVHNL